MRGEARASRLAVAKATTSGTRLEVAASSRGPILIVRSRRPILIVRWRWPEVIVLGRRRVMIVLGRIMIVWGWGRRGTIIVWGRTPVLVVMRVGGKRRVWLVAMPVCGRRRVLPAMIGGHTVPWWGRANANVLSTAETTTQILIVGLVTLTIGLESLILGLESLILELESLFHGGEIAQSFQLTKNSFSNMNVGIFIPAK